MTDADLDASYTALCEALAEVGEGRSQLLLSMVSLALMAQRGSAAEVLPLIAKARAHCLQEPAGGDAAPPAEASGAPIIAA